MTNPIAQRRELHYRPEGSDEYVLAMVHIQVYCPGCKDAHHFTTEVHNGYNSRADKGEQEPVWEFDGNMESPTFSPSLLHHLGVHLCEGEHVYEACDQEFSECGHKGHGYHWDLPDGTQRIFKVYEYDEIPEGSVRHTHGPGGQHPRDPAYGPCHSFLKAGVWQFLSDSAHDLAGQNVPVPPLPDWMIRD